MRGDTADPRLDQWAAMTVPPEWQPLVDLHSPSPWGKGWECDGCDSEYGEPPKWPCRTAEAVLDALAGDDQ